MPYIVVEQRFMFILFLSCCLGLRACFIYVLAISERRSTSSETVIHCLTPCVYDSIPQNPKNTKNTPRHPTSSPMAPMVNLTRESEPDRTHRKLHAKKTKEQTQKCLYLIPSTYLKTDLIGVVTFLIGGRD